MITTVLSVLGRARWPLQVGTSTKTPEFHHPLVRLHLIEVEVTFLHVYVGEAYVFFFFFFQI